jgi:hypothetical protein
MYLTLKEEHNVEKNVWTQERWSEQEIQDNNKHHELYRSVAGRQQWAETRAKLLSWSIALRKVAIYKPTNDKSYF